MEDGAAISGRISQRAPSSKVLSCSIVADAEYRGRNGGSGPSSRDNSVLDGLDNSVISSCRPSAIASLPMHPVGHPSAGVSGPMHVGKTLEELERDVALGLGGSACTEPEFRRFLFRTPPPATTCSASQLLVTHGLQECPGQGSPPLLRNESPNRPGAPWPKALSAASLTRCAAAAFSAAQQIPTADLHTRPLQPRGTPCRQKVKGRDQSPRPTGGSVGSRHGWRSTSSSPTRGLSRKSLTMTPPSRLPLNELTGPPPEPAEEPQQSMVEVFLRVRPPNARERNDQVCVQVNRNAIGVDDGNADREHWFEFKQVLDSCTGSCNQEDVFEAMGQQALDSIYDGFHTCIFSSGQTGTGKTYTLLGTPDDPGLLPRMLRQLLVPPRRCRLSCLELYMDRFRDLLGDDTSDKPPPEVRCAPHRGVYVSNVSEITVDNPDAAMKLVHMASEFRNVARTSMNATSSRGHAIYQIVLESGAKLCVVDLAGRENERDTGCHGKSLAELSYINKSLFHLTNVIQALAKPNRTPRDRVPFRDSKLTFLLSDCLQHARTFLLATVSPVYCNVDETLTTLRLAQAVRQITTRSQRQRTHRPAVAAPPGSATSCYEAANCDDPCKLPTEGSAEQRSSLSGRSGWSAISTACPEGSSTYADESSRVSMIAANARRLHAVLGPEGHIARLSAAAGHAAAPCARSDDACSSSSASVASSRLLVGQHNSHGTHLRLLAGLAPEPIGVPLPFAPRLGVVDIASFLNGSAGGHCGGSSPSSSRSGLQGNVPNAPLADRAPNKVLTPRQCNLHEVLEMIPPRLASDRLQAWTLPDGSVSSRGTTALSANTPTEPSPHSEILFLKEPARPTRDDRWTSAVDQNVQAPKCSPHTSGQSFGEDIT